MHLNYVVLVFRVRYLIEVSEDSLFHLGLVEKSCLVFDNLDRHNFPCLLADAFCNLAKGALAQHLTDNVPAHVVPGFVALPALDIWRYA